MSPSFNFYKKWRTRNWACRKSFRHNEFNILSCYLWKQRCCSDSPFLSRLSQHEIKRMCSRNCLPFRVIWVHHRFLVEFLSLVFCEVFCRSLCVLISFGHCTVCSFSTYGFWLTVSSNFSLKCYHTFMCPMMLP